MKGPWNIANPLTDDGRNKINEMFQELYNEYREAGLNAKEAREKAHEAVMKSDEAMALSERTQKELSQAILEGDSSPLGGQLSVGADGTIYSNPQERFVTEFNSVNQNLAQTEDELFSRGVNVKTPPVPLMGVQNNGEDEKDIINNIISYAHENGIKNVLFPDGVYKVDPGSFEGLPNAGSGGIRFLDNITLILSPNAKIKALPSEGAGYNIIRGFRNKNIGIIGGVIEGERNEHLGIGGEWGHGVNLRGCENVFIDTTVTNCWGDGVYLGSGENGYPCKQVSIGTLKAYNNRRQGISLAHVDGFYFDTLILEGTNGTPPQSGIDIEPNANEFVKNGFINNIESKYNSGAGVQVYADRDGAYVDNIVIDKIISTNNKEGFLVRKAKVKGVSVKTLICKDNVSEGMWVREGSTGVTVGLLIAENNGYRGLAFSGVEGNFINVAKLINNDGVGFEFSGNSGENVINTLIVEGSDATDYCVAGYVSKGIKVGKSILRKANISAVYFDRVDDSDMSPEVSDIGRYPIRLLDSNNNNFNNAVFKDQAFEVGNAFSLIRLEGSSSDNNIVNSKARLENVKARYAVQMLDNTSDNYIAFNDFKDSYEQAMHYDTGLNNELAHNRYN